MYRKRRGAYRASAGKTEEKRPLERFGRRWEYNNTVYLQEI
jgi:hypothetical protein